MSGRAVSVDGGLKATRTTIARKNSTLSMTTTMMVNSCGIRYGFLREKRKEATQIVIDELSQSYTQCGSTTEYSRISRHPRVYSSIPECFTEVFRSYGYLLPAIIASMLLANGPKAFLMALALPLGQSAISLAIDKLWGGGEEEPRTSPRIRRKPFSRSSADFRKQGQDESSDAYKKKAVYQSWVATDNGLNEDKARGSEQPSFGGWDDLDQQSGQVRRRPSRAERSYQSSQVKMGKLSKKGRYRDAPLILRLLIAVFPFLGSWIRIL